MLKNKFANKRNVKPKKVYWSWLGSYILVLIIPVIIGALLYTRSVQVIDEEVNRAHNASLEQAKTVLDGYLIDTRRTGKDLTYNNKLRELMYQSKNLTPENYMVMYKLQKDMINIVTSNSNIESIYIYFKNSDYILSNTKRITASNYESAIPLEFNIEASHWLDMVEVNSSETYKIVSFDDGSGRITKKMLYICPVYGTSYTKPDADIVMLIDVDYLVQVLQNIQWTKDSSISIIDDSDSFISSDNIDTLPDFIRYDHLENDSDMFKDKYNGDDVTVTHVSSDIGSWKYVSVIPEKVFLEKVDYIKNILYAYIALCLIIGCVIAFVSVRRNYKPLEKITRILSANSTGDAGQNEFKYIEDSMIRLFEEKAGLKDQLAKQEGAMRNNFLIRLMKGRVVSALSFSDACEAYDIRFTGNTFVVMIFLIDSLNDMLSEDNPEDVDLINLIIQHVNEEIFSTEYRGYMAEVDGRMSCVINIAPDIMEQKDDSKVKSEIEEIALLAIKLLEDKFGMTLSVAISGFHSEYKGIAHAYSEAVEVIEYKTLVDDINPVVFFDTLFNIKKPGMDESVLFNKERQFTNCIVNEDYMGAGDILNDILVNDLLKTTSSLQIIKCRLFGLLNTMLNVMGMIRVTRDAELFDDVDMVARLMNSKSIPEVQKQVNYIFSRLNEYYGKDKENKPVQDKYTEIVDYVKENYTDPNISVSGVSELFGTSISSLSRMFKKNAGIGMLDFIHKLRLEKAKELLTNTDMTVKDIAKEVGYYSDVAIIRVFNRYEGITPGKFRELELGE